MNQTAAQVTNQYIVEAQSEHVLVSAHLGARTQPEGQPALAGHDNWQGRVYRIVESEPEYPNLLESTGYDINPGTGIGKVINPLGLHGYNCRHSHKPWDIRLRNPYVDENGNLKIDSEENRKRYELQQKQRAMERGIRKTKRELVVKQQQIDSVAETDVKNILQNDYDKLALALTKQNQAYNKFCADNNLQPQYDRIKAANFSRKQEKVAKEAARRYQKEHNNSDTVVKNTVKNVNGVEKTTNTDIIKVKNNLKNYIGYPIISTDNKSVREWYVANVNDISNQIDRAKPFEDQARQAFELQNQYKHEARVAMANKETAKLLDEFRAEKTFEELLSDKMRHKGLTRREALEDILKTASITNANVDKEFGL